MLRVVHIAFVETEKVNFNIFIKSTIKLETKHRKAQKINHCEN